MTAHLSRRRLLALGLSGLALPALVRAQQTPAAQAPTDGLYDPNSLERRPAIVEESANDATVKAAELRLACPCPCTLDVFTCRTTDFTCSYSPARHAEVVALVEGQGMSEQQVIDAMVQKYGQEALMAPIAKGFNLVGYVLPASVILGLGAVIVAVLAVRQRRESEALVPVSTPGNPAVSAEDLARVERELRDLES